jgi:hypothetical protein
MVSKRIREQIEDHPLVKSSINVSRYGKDWSQYPRTVFEGIARKINQDVTQKAIINPVLIADNLIVGQDELDTVFFKQSFTTLDDFLKELHSLNSYKPYHWISGKTLHSYWNNGNAKDKKLNVLLTFLGIPLEEWDEWKNQEPENILLPSSDQEHSHSMNVLRKYFTGCYYRYYQKTDNSPTLVKTPFIIRTSFNGEPVVETKTIGHEYRSMQIAMRDGALYIDCENIDWDEKESFIFNVGFETNPQVLIGVSNTLNRRKQALGIKNVLVRQVDPFDYRSVAGREIPFDGKEPVSEEEASVLSYFKNAEDNLIITHYCYSLEELTLPRRVLE